MSLPSSGPISESMIRTELNIPTQSPFSLNLASELGYTDINVGSLSVSNGTLNFITPTSQSRWQGYNHSYVASANTAYNNCKAPLGYNYAAFIQVGIGLGNQYISAIATNLTASGIAPSAYVSYSAYYTTYSANIRNSGKLIKSGTLNDNFIYTYNASSGSTITFLFTGSASTGSSTTNIASSSFNGTTFTFDATTSNYNYYTGSFTVQNNSSTSHTVQITDTSAVGSPHFTSPTTGNVGTTNINVNGISVGTAPTLVIRIQNNSTGTNITLSSNTISATNGSISTTGGGTPAITVTVTPSSNNSIVTLSGTITIVP